MRYIKKVLKNGLRVILVPIADNPTVTVLVLVEAGSKYENKKNNGISHFLEHMCFKGTEKRPRAIDISKELDSIGSQYNAFTSQEYTGYYAKSASRHFKKIFNVVSDIYLNATFPEAEMQKEKGVIIEEINMYEDLPNYHVQDLLLKLLYGDQPAGWNIAGEKKNILAMQRADFVQYKKEHYLPEVTTLVIAGRIDLKEAWREVHKVFGSIARGKKSDKIKTIEKQNKPEILVKYKKTDQTHFVLGFRSYDLFNKKNSSLAVLSGILGGGMSSRLFQKLREEMGVGYYVKTSNDNFTDHGVFQISAGVDNRRIQEVIKVILEECQKLKDNLVDEAELKKVKEYLIGNAKLFLESSDSIASFLGGQELLEKKLKSIEEKAKEIKKVNAKDIQKIAQEIFQNNKLNLALIGPFQNKAQFTKILKF